ncbi:phosphatase PAP2 family protein [Halostella sp. JP-L12]|uniref:phosphatase PAP2 family protein n=1 Tax=Halostella TaxID=1843185 RepID=UPI000EF7E2C0|nr:MULTISPECIES: phosphatase PAP2 family protein [Halostella]NHN47942.1 phosphatase PAP2 family protein [Halostella sp. JP-L12]
MSLLSQAMTYYPYVFHPITVVGGSVLLLIRYEWARRSDDRSSLRRRVVAFLGAGLLALVPTVTYFAVTGAAVIRSTMGNAWVMDALVASGLFIAAAATWGAWRRFDWGELVPGLMTVVAVVAVPYVALSPFWNVSGHVLIALAPTLFLTLVDRSYWPLLVVPVVMVPNRIYLDAHTWAQSIGGFVLAATVTAGIYRLRTGGSPGSDRGLTDVLD